MGLRAKPRYVKPIRRGRVLNTVQWNSFVCRIDTARAAARWRLTLARLAFCAWVVLGAGLGVASAQMLSPDWRKIGGTAAELMLASPATGPVEAVWFSANGSRLYARTL